VLAFQRRTGYLFLAISLGHVMLISAQVNSASGVSALEQVTFGAFAAVQRAASAGIGAVQGVWDGYVGLRGTYEKNRQLEQELAELRVRLQEERALAQRSRQLETLLGLRSATNVPSVAASVISADPTPWFRTITIDKGAEAGIRRDMAVIAPAGVVGRIVGEVAPHAARVQLLIDRNAAAGAQVERSRATGVVAGIAGDPPLEMQYVSSVADVVVGDAVVTSGIDGIYPKGFVIGRVSSTIASGSGTRTIRIQPAVDFASLEDVLVLLTPEVKLPPPEGSE
jgi:rod shape-determining protein MreC